MFGTTVESKSINTYTQPKFMNKMLENHHWKSYAYTHMK